MRRVYRKSRPRPAVALMILPMIDVIFLLLLFFALLSNFEASQKVAVEVPKPDASQAQADRAAQRVVINCAPANPDAPDLSPPLYRIGADPPEALEVISARLAAAKASNPDLKVVIRADRRLTFSAVRAAMQVVARNNIQIMNIAALRSSD